MSIPFEGFCGISYQLQNKFASVERTVNWLLDVNETTDEKKYKIALIPAPSNSQFGPLPVPAPFNQPVRAMLEYRGSVFGVSGDVIWVMDSNGVQTNLLGGITVDANPASMVGNGNNQIFVASGGAGYCITVKNPASTSTVLGFATGVDFLGASYVTFQDGYIIVVTPNSNQFQISGTDDTPVGDATLWSAANISIQAGQADLLQNVFSSREYLFLLGKRRSQVYQNVGNNGQGGFPFVSYNETFIETGNAAVFSLQEFEESLIWIGQDARGRRACWRMSAFQPQRVSNFAVEQIWDTYPTVADAVAFTMIWQGHSIYQITFPTAGKTWIYDATISQLTGRPAWTERNYLRFDGQFLCRPEQAHCFAFGKHLVGSAGGDGNPGAIYQYTVNPSPGTNYDCGINAAGGQDQRPIVRDRICPHLFNTGKRSIYNRIWFEVTHGSGLDGSGGALNPTLMLRWSNDGGNTYSFEQQIKTGPIGQYSKLIYFNRAGMGRDRIFWVRYSDSAYMALTNAYLDVVPLGS